MLKRQILNGNLLFGIAALLLLLGVWVWQNQNAAARQFERIGVQVEARIVELQRSVRPVLRNGIYGESSPSYSATVAYSTGSALDGTLKIYRNSMPISSNFYDQLREGQTITIRHLPDDPTIIELEPNWTSNNGLYALLICGGFALLPLLGGHILRNLARVAARLAKNGIRTTGVLTRIIPVPKMALLEFTFQDTQGNTYTAQSKPHRQWLNSTLQPGAKIDIIYDPEAPHGAQHISDVAR